MSRADETDFPNLPVDEFRPPLARFEYAGRNHAVVLSQCKMACSWHRARSQARFFSAASFSHP
jgi:hypothetical protein